MWMGDAWQAYNRRGDENRRSRREIAQAWELYRANNPYATFEEMQGWIDQMSGDRNYLRGGAPSGDILRGIAEGNAENRRIRDQERQLAELQRRNEMRGQLEGLAQQYLLESNGDVVAAAERMREDLGVDNLGGFEIDGLFTPDAYNRIVQGQVRENYDAAAQWIADSTTTDADGNAIRPSAEEVAQYFGLPAPVAEQILERAEADALRVDQERQASLTATIRQQETDIIARVNELAAMDMAPEDISSYLRERYSLTDADMQSLAPIIESVTATVEQSLGRAGIEQIRTDLDAVEDRIRASLISRDPADPNGGAISIIQGVIDDLSAAYRARMTPQQLDPQTYLAQFIAETQAIQEGTIAQRNQEAYGTALETARTRAEESQAAVTAFLQDVEGNEMAKAALRGISQNYYVPPQLAVQLFALLDSSETEDVMGLMREGEQFLRGTPGGLQTIGEFEQDFVDRATRPYQYGPMSFDQIVEFHVEDNAAIEQRVSSEIEAIQNADNMSAAEKIEALSDIPGLFDELIRMQREQIQQLAADPDILEMGGPRYNEARVQQEVIDPLIRARQLAERRVGAIITALRAETALGNVDAAQAETDADLGARVQRPYTSTVVPGSLEYQAPVGPERLRIDPSTPSTTLPNTPPSQEELESFISGNL